MSSRFVWAIGIAVLTLANLTTLAANLSMMAHAQVPGMDYRDLENDPVFRRAVENIAEDTAKRVVGTCLVTGNTLSC